MGKLTYDSSLTVEFDDRVLAHLSTVITAKLRRGECFSFSWKDDPAAGDGRTSIWLHPTIPIVFKFYGGRAPVLNRAWVEALMLTANSPHGLHLVNEPEQAEPAAQTGSVGVHA
ncbi:ATP-dependent DNA ligase [Herbiconiux sp. CPCC 205716]|uniref:ATP-dependent DNA ligase n=1 Tax=Herbiconiux gentiana TaxID=2970912 RepID=A0ABT2GFB8_9MICO|nr:ATP-dependent DNA ligase [Herbiconiux gentiana]MCS5714918.1 ATP-dependent DNA ligase [Herbiconiux gentiana]